MIGSYELSYLFVCLPACLSVCLYILATVARLRLSQRHDSVEPAKNSGQPQRVPPGQIDHSSRCKGSDRHRCCGSACLVFRRDEMACLRFFFSFYLVWLTQFFVLYSP